MEGIVQDIYTQGQTSNGDWYDPNYNPYEDPTSPLFDPEATPEEREDQRLDALFSAIQTQTPPLPEEPA